jgi:multidrug efflux pump
LRCPLREKSLCVLYCLTAPSTQWWTQLSSAIAGGLSFATVLTLLLTPCLLVLGSRFERRPPPLETFDDDLLDLPEHLLAAKPAKASLNH